MRATPRAFLATAALLLLATAGKTAEQRKAIAMEKVEYRGWANNLRLSNGDAELIATLDVGPRVISYRLAGGKNAFKEYAEQLGKSGEAGWMIRGGHRLWAGPEDTTRTYALDNGPVRVRELGPLHVRLTAAPDGEYGIGKEIDLKLAETGSRVTVTHRITAVGREPAELAPWALTVLNPGGVEVIPLPPKAPHPGGPSNAKSQADFAPNQLYVAWPYTDFGDGRWSFGTKSITLRQDGKLGPTKLGAADRVGVVGYLNGGTLFVKRFGYQAGKVYPDGGCNFETFTSHDMVEIETLGPLVRLTPGQAVEHVETWELLPNVEDARERETLEQNVLPKLGVGGQ